MAKVGSLIATLGLDNARFESGLRDSVRDARRFAERTTRNFRRVGTSAKRAEKDVRGMSRSLAGFGAGFGLKGFSGLAGLAVSSFIAIGASLRKALDVNRRFGQSMSTVKAVTGATEEQFEGLSDEARRLGAITRFSASQAADGMVYLARAGFDAEQSLKAIEGTLKLAQAGALDLAASADIASNVLTGFGLVPEAINRVADVLAYTANSSNTSVLQLGEAMSYAASNARALDVSVEDASAVIGILGNVGIQGSRAGTVFNGILRNLSGVAPKAQRALAKYGLTMEDVDIKSRGMIPVLETLAERQISFADAVSLFQARNAGGAQGVLMQIDLLKKLADANREAEGTADNIATIMDDNVNGAILRLNSAWEELLLTLNDVGWMTGFMDGLADAIRAIDTLIERFATFSDQLDGVGEFDLKGTAGVVYPDTVIPAHQLPTPFMHEGQPRIDPLRVPHPAGIVDEMWNEAEGIPGAHPGWNRHRTNAIVAPEEEDTLDKAVQTTIEGIVEEADDSLKYWMATTRYGMTLDMARQLDFTDDKLTSWFLDHYDEAESAFFASLSSSVLPDMKPHDRKEAEATLRHTRSLEERMATGWDPDAERRAMGMLTDSENREVLAAITPSDDDSATLDFERYLAGETKFGEWAGQFSAQLSDNVRVALLNEDWGSIGRAFVQSFKAEFAAAVADMVPHLVKFLGTALITAVDKMGGGGLVDAALGAVSKVGEAFGGFRAEGGPVSADKFYVTGESGPELFAPGVSGSVLPNSMFASAAPAMAAPPVAPADTTVNVPVVMNGDMTRHNREWLMATMPYIVAQVRRDLGRSR